MAREKLRTLRVDDERWERAGVAAKALGLSVAELCRRGIDLMVAKSEKVRRG